MPEPEQVRDEVLNFLHRLNVEADREVAQVAVGWVFLSFDEDAARTDPDRIGNPSVYGPFDTQQEALVAAEAHFRGVNVGAVPGDGWKTRVLPLIPVGV